MTQPLFSNFFLYLWILEISSVPPQQIRSEVLAFKVMFLVQDSVYLQLQSPNYIDSTGILGGMKQQGCSKFNLETQMSILHSALFS